MLKNFAEEKLVTSIWWRSPHWIRVGGVHQMKSCLFQRLALSTDREGVFALATYRGSMSTWWQPTNWHRAWGEKDELLMELVHIQNGKKISQVKTCWKHYKWKTANFQICYWRLAVFFLAQKVCFINNYSYLCSTRTRQASQRCSNVRVVFVYIRFFSKYANGKMHLSGYRVWRICSSSSSSSSFVAQLVTNRQMISVSLFLSHISNATFLERAS